MPYRKVKYLPCPKVIMPGPCCPCKRQQEALDEAAEQVRLVKQLLDQQQAASPRKNPWEKR